MKSLLVHSVCVLLCSILSLTCKGLCDQCPDIEIAGVPSGLPSCSASGDTVDGKYYVYYDTDTHKAILSSARTTTSTVVVPSTVEVNVSWDCIEQFKVVGVMCRFNGAVSVEFPDGILVDNGLFSNSKTIESVILPSDLKRIPDALFKSCQNLRSVTGPTAVESVGEDAFNGCTSLTVIPETGSIRNVDASGFRGCRSLGAFLSTELRTVGDDAFRGCSSLSSVLFREGLVAIGSMAFYGADSLENADLPVGIGEIGEKAFAYSGVVHATLPADLSEKVGGIAMFAGCKNLVDVKLSRGLQCIPEEMFDFCSSLTNVDIPASVERIGAGAFEWTGLKSITLPESLKKIEAETFNSCESLESISWPKELEEIGKLAFFSAGITNADFTGTKLAMVGDRAFDSCGSLTNGVFFPRTLLSLGSQALSHIGFNMPDVEVGDCDVMDDRSRLTVSFLGPPPDTGDDLLAYESEFAVTWLGNYCAYQYMTYEDEFEDAWMNAIETFRASHIEKTWDWHNLTVRKIIIVEPTDWKLETDGKQTLTISWHFPTNATYTIDQATADLKALGKRYKIYRGKDDKKYWDDFSKKECIVESTSDLSYPDEAFGDIKGTHPVRYWVEVIGEGAMNTPEPVHCDTRRRFGLAIGLSAYSDTAYMKYRDYSCYQGKPKELGGFVNDTKKFVQLLKDSGGVVDMSDGGAGDVILLTDEQATTEGIASAISGFPIKNGKPRFVPGDIAFLWIATHGLAFQDDGEGGINAYDGEYHNSFGSCYAKEYNGMKIRNTFLDDLSWVDDNPGVRVIGILPFCYAEKMTRGFDKKENVAWVAATCKDEQSTLNDKYTQFGKFFLEYGWDGGVAYREYLQFASAFVKDYFNLPSIGDNDGTLDFLELARYTQCLSIGRSSRSNDQKKVDIPWEPVGNPSHLQICNPTLLKSVNVKSATTVKTSNQVPELNLDVKLDDKSGCLRVYYNQSYIPGYWTKIYPDAVILWYRPVLEQQSSAWKWVKIDQSMLEEGNKVDEHLWVFDNAIYFGSGTDNQVNEIGMLLPNTQYEFRLQGVNEYGYGKFSRTIEARTGNLATSAKQNFASALSGSGEIQYAGSVDVGGECFLLHLTAGCEGDGYRITAHVGGDLVCSAFVADIGEDGALSVNEPESVTSHVLRSLKMSLDGAEGSFDGKGFKADIVVDKRDWPDETTIPANEQYENDSIATSIAGEVSYSAKSLPKGLSIDSSTGVISGIPTVPGSYVVLVTVKSKTDPTQVETIEVPIVVGNYVDETIAVDDEYGPFVPGEKVELKFPEGAAWKVTGLPTGLKWDAKLPGVTGVPTKPGSNTVYFTWTDKTMKPNVTHKASSTFIVGPLPKASVQIDGKGKVTGAGAHLAGKKVTLKATAGKGNVFAGWYLGGELVTKSASYSFKATGEDVDYRARFVTLAEDKASIRATVNGMAFSSTSGQETASPLATNAMCGVALFWPLSHEALSATSVKVTGLPKGLKYDTKKKAITGTPTAPGKTSSVKVAVTTAGKQKATFVLKVTVDPLPEWARGQFTENVDENVLTMTVGSTGKVSGKFKDGITNWTFSASSFATNSVTVGDTNLFCRATAKGTYKNAKKKTVTVSAPIAFELVARPDVSPIAAEGLGDFADRTDNVEIWRIAAAKLSVNNAKGGTVKTDKSYGQAAAGAKVKLTATLKKGYTLLGWYDEVTGELLSQKMSFSLVSDGVTDRFVEARFTKESDFSASDFTLGWDGLTNLTVGVAYSAKLTVSGAAAVKIASVSGLPKGLTWKSGKVSGVATTAKTNTVSVKVALVTNTKKTWTLKQTLVVEPLPEWATGTFEGDLGTEDELVPVTVTIGSSGKVSGKYGLDGATWTFSASSLSSAVYDETTHEPQSFAVNVTASATINRKKKSQKLVVTVMEEGVDIQVP